MSKLQVAQHPITLPDGGPGLSAKLSGSIDASTVPQFEEHIERFLSDGTKILVLNCADVVYINSTGMGLIIKCVDKFRNNGGDLKLVSVPPKVVTLFKMLGLESLVTMYSSEAAAIESIQPAAPAPPPERAQTMAQQGPPSRGPSFPVQFKCPSCQGVLEIRTEGKYRCPRCGSFFNADASGSVKSYPPRKWKTVELRVPCDVEDIEWVRTMVASHALRQKFTTEESATVEQAVDEACTLIAQASPPGAPSYQVAALSSGTELIVAVYSYLCGTTFRDEKKSRGALEMMRNCMDKVEVVPLPPNGQMIKMSKTTKG